MFYTYLAWSGLARTDDNRDYIFQTAAEFFEDPTPNTPVNETVDAYNFHINAVNSMSTKTID